MPILHQILLILFLTASFLSIVAAYQFFRYRTHMARWGGSFVFFLAVELASYAMQWISVSWIGSMRWFSLQIICFYLLPILWLFCVAEVTGFATIKNRRFLIGIFCIPIVVLIILLMQRLNSQVFFDPALIAVGSVFRMVPILGPAGAFFPAYFYGVGLLSLLVVLRLNVDQSASSRLLTIPMLIGTLLTVLMGAMEHAGFNIFNPVPLMQVGLAGASVLIFLFAFVFRFAGIYPIGRDSAFEIMHDGIILLDADNHIIDLNAPAERIIGLSKMNALNMAISAVWPAGAALLSEQTNANLPMKEHVLSIGSGEFIFEVTITRLIGLNNTSTGCLIVLRNVTEREQLEKTLIEQSQVMSRTNALMRELAEAELHVQESTDVASIYKALSSPLRKIDLDCFITRLDPHSNVLSMDYFSNPRAVIAPVEKLLGFPLSGYKFNRSDFPNLYAYLERDEGDCSSKTYPVGEIFGGDGISRGSQSSLADLGVNPETPVMLLHLNAGAKRLGLIGIWGRGLRQDHLDPLRLFAGQVALSIEKISMYDNEVARAAELSRSNGLISALAKVSSQMGTSSNSSNALATLGEELEKIGLHCVLATADPAQEILTFQYASFLSKIDKQARMIPGFNFIGHTLPKDLWPGEMALLREGIPDWYSTPITVFQKMLPQVPERVFKQALKNIGATPEDNFCVLPLMIEGQVTGVLLIWGNGIQEKDTPAMMIFAHQVAEILRKTKDYEMELARANSLARTNAMVIALSHVAALLETTTNMTEVFETLGKELRKIDIICMVGTLQENKQVLKIEYLSISQEVITWAKKFGANLPDEIRIPRHLWPTDKSVTDKVPSWDPNPIGNVGKMFPYIPKSVFSKAFGMAGMDPENQVCYLPMISEEDVIGILAVWGPTIQKDDIPGLSVFANQVATAIRNTTLYNQAQQEILIRTQAEETVKAALNEKEVLLKEIHHRVKNNLQIISSLLNLQMGQADDVHSIEGLRESQNRVRAMALIHEKLYQSEDLAQISLSAYIHSLTNSLAQTYRSLSGNVSIQVETDSILLDLDTAIPCGLIINELVSNALKYAFPGQRKGCIRVSCFETEDGHYALIVGDDGVGFAPDFDPSKTTSLGLKLVSSLVQQINGKMNVDGSQGARFEIRFARAKAA